MFTKGNLTSADDAGKMLDRHEQMMQGLGIDAAPKPGEYNRY